MDPSPPLIFFVREIELNPEHIPQRKQRISVIDIEISVPDALKLRDELTKRLENGEPGAFRFRFTGRLHI